MTDDNNAPKLDLGLIQMVQRARMMNDANAKPSEVSAVYWIEAKAPDPNPTSRAGKWIVPTTVDVVDALWAKVKAATEGGELGYKAKVSTAPGKEQGHASARLLHVRVADSDAAADVERVRAALEALGVTDMRYERDSA
jgi:hypothetical protein